jgi:hypothetical protein
MFDSSVNEYQLAHKRRLIASQTKQERRSLPASVVVEGAKYVV